MGNDISLRIPSYFADQHRSRPKSGHQTSKITLRRGIENSGFWSRSRLRREGFPPRFSLYILRQPSSPTGVPSASASVMKTFAHRHFTDFLMT
ncbi:uncharacterized protein [Temnothorax nylanderi]|uniref:uncharacterized protein isoform X3 n=1 Tax=Temnothorax nylanderi TaxID=102681 RepID=UPI003A8A12CD